MATPSAPDDTFFRRDPVDAAAELLNKLLAGPDGRVGRIVEVEAYRGHTDEASHACRGPTVRNRSMFGPPGTLYVYRSYGVHWCANVVMRSGDEAGAVLLRAADAVGGLDAMRDARWRHRSPGSDRDLCRGPGRLCRALGIDGSHDGVDLRRSAGEIRLLDDGTPPPSNPLVGPRVGISRAVDLPWRFAIRGHRAVSGPRTPNSARSSQGVAPGGVH